MNDNLPLEPLEPLDIDDRSGGERIAAAGRAAASRLGSRLDGLRLDVAGLIWMACVTVVVAVQIYSALHVLDGSAIGFGTWEKISALGGQTAGPTIAVSCFIGIVLAAWFDTAAARFTLYLATLVGAWVLTAGVLVVASSAHSAERIFTFGRENRAAGIIGGFGLAGLGFVIVLIAWPLARNRTAPEVN